MHQNRLFGRNRQQPKKHEIGPLSRIAVQWLRAKYVTGARQLRAGLDDGCGHRVGWSVPNRRCSFIEEGDAMARMHRSVLGCRTLLRRNLWHAAALASAASFGRCSLASLQARS